MRMSCFAQSIRLWSKAIEEDRYFRKNGVNDYNSYHNNYKYLKN